MRKKILILITIFTLTLSACRASENIKNVEHSNDTTTETTIAPTTMAPTTTMPTDELVTTTTEPVTTTTEPVTTTAEPVTTTTEPVTTTAEPVTTTAEPAITTTEAVATTNEVRKLLFNVPEGFVSSGQEGQYIHSDYPADTSNIGHVIVPANAPILPFMDANSILKELEEQYEATFQTDVTISLIEYDYYNVDIHMAFFLSFEIEVLGQKMIQLQAIVSDIDKIHYVTYTDAVGGGHYNDFKTSALSIRFEYVPETTVKPETTTPNTETAMSINFQIHEDFVATDIAGYYVHKDYPKKHSNIKYTEIPNDGSFIMANSTYLLYTLENEFKNTYQTDIPLTLVEEEYYKIGDRNAFLLSIEYELMGINLVQLDVIIDGPEKLHFITYTMDKGSAYYDVFKASAKNITFK